MSTEERGYLEAMARVVDAERVAKTSDIARTWGKTLQQASRPRGNLIKNGVIISVGRGEVMFNIPYLRDYVLKEPLQSANVALVRQWGL